jgi:hypothetical protein
MGTLVFHSTGDDISDIVQYNQNNTSVFIVYCDTAPDLMLLRSEEELKEYVRTHKLVNSAYATISKFLASPGKPVFVFVSSKLTYIDRIRDLISYNTRILDCYLLEQSLIDITPPGFKLRD